MVWARDMKVILRVPKSGGQVEAHRDENERTSKEAMGRWKQDLNK